MVVSHPSAIKLRMDGAPKLFRWVECGLPGDMISLQFYCLVLHTSYPSVDRISIVMLSLGAWSGLASIAGVALLSRISRITLVTRLSGVALSSRISRVTLVTRFS